VASSDEEAEQGGNADEIADEFFIF
jgi:hypothetical protein